LSRTGDTCIRLIHGADHNTRERSTSSRRAWRSRLIRMFPGHLFFVCRFDLSLLMFRATASRRAQWAATDAPARGLAVFMRNMNGIMAMNVQPSSQYAST